MVPDRRTGSDRGGPPAADGGTGPGFDEAAMYVVVRDAVTDALLDVLGTILLLGVAFVLVFAGGQVLVTSLTTGAGRLPVVFGSLALLAFGLYLAAATLEVIPPAREWF